MLPIQTIDDPDLATPSTYFSDKLDPTCQSTWTLPVSQLPEAAVSAIAVSAPGGETALFLHGNANADGSDRFIGYWNEITRVETALLALSPCHVLGPVVPASPLDHLRLTSRSAAHQAFAADPHADIEDAAMMEVSLAPVVPPATARRNGYGTFAAASRSAASMRRSAVAVHQDWDRLSLVVRAEWETWARLGRRDPPRAVSAADGLRRPERRTPPPGPQAQPRPPASKPHAHKNGKRSLPAPSDPSRAAKTARLESCVL